jgi:hypothetical protein
MVMEKKGSKEGRKEARKEGRKEASKKKNFSISSLDTIELL